MSLSAYSLKYYKGGVQSVSLYTSTADVSAHYLSVRAGGSTLYADLSTVLTSSRASDLRVRSGGVTYAVMNEALAELPSGLIAGFETCPSGWTPLGWTLRFPMGSATYGSTGGGAHTHSVSIPSGTTGSTSPDPAASADSIDAGDHLDCVLSESPAHTHSSPAQTATSGSSSPSVAYYDIIICIKD